MVSAVFLPFFFSLHQWLFTDCDPQLDELVRQADNLRQGGPANPKGGPPFHPEAGPLHPEGGPHQPLQQDGVGVPPEARGLQPEAGEELQDDSIKTKTFPSKGRI